MDNQEFFRKYYTDDAWAALENRRSDLGSELKTQAEEGTRKWTALFEDIQASLDADPAGATAEELVARWQGLIDEFTGRDRGIEQGVARVWSDSANWPSQMHAQTRPFMDKRVWEFISRARAARLRL